MTEPRSIELLDFALLACDFRIVGVDDDDEEGGAAAAESESHVPASPEGIAVEGAVLSILSIEVDDEAREFVFILQTSLTDPGNPYELSVVTGSRFTVPEPPVTAIDAASTLLFITYPYVREVVYSITGRSPYSGFKLPPLTKRPVWGETASAE